MKQALVLEGGASRGYFSVGVMDVLMENDIKLNYVIGASAGIANGASYVSGQIGRSWTIGEKYMHDKRYMGLKHLLNPKNRSLYNIDFVFREIPETILPYDFEASRVFGKDAYAAVTNLKTGKPEYLPMQNEQGTWDAIVASCALPLLFRPVEIDGNLYMDGGIADPIPVDKAFADGCEKAIVVLTRERTYVKEYEKALGLAAFIYRRYPAFRQAIRSRTEAYNRAHQHILDLEKQGKIFVIAPQNTKDWGRTDKEPEKLRVIYEAGRKETQENLEKIKKYLEN